MHATLLLTTIPDCPSAYRADQDRWPTCPTWAKRQHHVERRASPTAALSKRGTPLAERPRMASSSSIPPFDFLEFVAQKQSMKAPAATKMVGRWLLDYEPGERALSMGARPRGKAMRSQVRAKRGLQARRAA